MCYQMQTLTWYFDLGRKVAREGHKDLCLGRKQRVELASPNFLSPQGTRLKTQVTSPVAAAPSSPGDISTETPGWKRIRALLGPIGQDLPY